MNSSLDGKTAFVTGGSRGIGAAVAVRLAHEGADVAFTYVANSQRAADVAGWTSSSTTRVRTTSALSITSNTPSSTPPSR